MAKQMGWIGFILPSIGAIALCLMGSVTIADILLRSLFNRPIQGSYEIVQLCLVTSIYAGLGETFRRGANITVDLVDHLAPRLAAKVLAPLGHALSFLVLAIFFVGAIQRGLKVADYGDVTMDLKMPAWWFWIPVLIGIAWALVCIPAMFFTELSRKGK